MNKIYIVQVFAYGDIMDTEVFILKSDAVKYFNSKIASCKQESETLEENNDTFLEEEYFANDEFTVLLSGHIVK